MAIKSKRGGQRVGAGRKAGVPNKLTFEIKQAASVHGNEVLSTLMKIIRDSETPANVTVAACRELLDRGFGRPAVSIEVQPVNVNVFPARLSKYSNFECILISRLMD
ncbi:hypothetical protein [Methylobacter svalbardensis]|uniref:hypothetical protein n=1 Tax=Methylobacter svalbardensis TaxID=3080016 RepID=UPI0030EBDE44